MEPSAFGSYCQSKQEVPALQTRTRYYEYIWSANHKDSRHHGRLEQWLEPFVCSDSQLFAELQFIHKNIDSQNSHTETRKDKKWLTGMMSETCIMQLTKQHCKICIKMTVGDFLIFLFFFPVREQIGKKQHRCLSADGEKSDSPAPCQSGELASLPRAEHRRGPAQQSKRLAHSPHSTK